MKKRKCESIVKIDSFAEEAVQGLVYNFYLTEKCVPTVQALKQKLKNDLHFKGENTNVRRLLSN